MRAGRGSSGTPRSGSSSGFATSTAMPAGLPLFGITIVKDDVLARRLRQLEVFVPLRHDPGPAQADFGEAVAEIARVERKIHFFAVDLPHSDGCFVQAYPAETTEAFCDGHNAAFGLFGGVPKSKGGPGQLAVAGALSRHRLLGTDRLWPPG